MFQKGFFHFISAGVLSFWLLILMVLAVYLGFKLSRWFSSKKSNQNGTSISFLSALFALNAFVLGFSFNMATNRYEMRRDQTVAEANAIGTAILRTNLYPDSLKSEMMKLFREYLDARIEFNNIKATDTSGMEALLTKTDNISGQIFMIAAAYSKQPGTLVPSNQMIPALNEMIDMATSRQQAYLAIVPESIVFMLFLLTICSGFLAGYANKDERMDWLVTSGFCILTAMVIYITLDLDRPRQGLIQLNEAEYLMTKIRLSLD